MQKTNYPLRALPVLRLLRYLLVKFAAYIGTLTKATVMLVTLFCPAFKK
uniref:Uncharacterized protein n=1 Tax=Arundo donax TaxID=35708 RepID=A0A0A9ENM1_ARUDO